MEYNHESEKNLEIQGMILMALQTPMRLPDLIRKCRIEYRVRKNDVIRNCNYLMVRKMAVVARKHFLYLEQDAPRKYVRKVGSKMEEKKNDD